MPTWLAPWFDGNVVDCLTIAVALLHTARRWRRADPRRRLIHHDTFRDFANGTALFPLALLCCGVVSSKAVGLLLTGNRIILTVAGVCSLVALLEE